MTAADDTDSIDWQQTLLTAGTRLLLFIVFWFNAVWIVDDYRITIASFYTQNVRLAFFLYLVEFLIEVYRGQIAATDRLSSHPFAVGLLRVAGITSGVAVVQLLVRWLLTVALTWILLRVPTPFTWLPYLAAVIPSVLGSVLAASGVLAWSRPLPSAGDVVRGASIASFEDAGKRLREQRRSRGKPR